MMVPMTDPTLKPCPFCGSSGGQYGGGFGEKQVRCTNNGCQGGLGGSCWQTTEADAALAWNTRAPVVRSRELRNILTDMAEELELRTNKFHLRAAAELRALLEATDES